MIAFIFVYSPAKFSVDGAEPIKRFERAPSERSDYVRAEPVIEAGSDGVLEAGIYATCAEGTASQLRELDPTRNGLDYDTVEIIKDKDPWPSIIDVSLERDGRAAWDRSQRIREHFRDVTEGDLKQFFISRMAPT